MLLPGTLGARIMAGATRSKCVGCLILAGEYFPKAAEDVFRSWGMTMFLKKIPDKPSTKGLLVYEDTTFGR